MRSLSRGERFDFVGAYFSAAWPQAEGEMLTLEAWRDGERVHADRLPLSHLGPVWFHADYRDIDRLRLATASGSHRRRARTDGSCIHPSQTKGRPRGAALSCNHTRLCGRLGDHCTMLISSPSRS